MARKKVELSYISNDSKRKTTLKKRKRGLMKKVHELSTLCGIDACAIVYSPFDSNPEVWPSISGAQRVISELKVLPQIDRQKWMVDLESFTRQRITKAYDHMKKQMKEGREMEMTEVMFQSLVGNMGMFHMNIVDFNDLRYLIDQYVKDLNHRKDILLSSGMEIGEPSNVVATSFEGIEPMANVMNSFSQMTTITEPMNLYAEQYEQPQDPNLNLNHNQPQLQRSMEMNYPEQMNDSHIHRQ